MKSSNFKNKDEIICDRCYKDFTQSTKIGGAIIKNCIFCPECIYALYKNKKIDKKSKPIFCPSYLTFREFVINFRKIL